MDLLGRVVSYTDVWDQVTDSTYDRPGRLVTTRSPLGRIDTDYDAANRITHQYWHDQRGAASIGTEVATPHYHPDTGELAWVDYSNNTHLGSQTAPLGRDPAGRTTLLSWTGPGGVLASDEVAYSQAGRVIDERIDGLDAFAGTGAFGTPGSANFADHPSLAGSAQIPW